MSAPAIQFSSFSAPTQAELVALVQGREGSHAELNQLADQLEQTYQSRAVPESIRMLIAVARNSMMSGNSGWFGPAQSRFSWATLVAQQRANPDEGIAMDRFRGKPEWFARLDRNRDGVITAEDLDWSERSTWMQHSYPVNRLLRRMDQAGNGRITRDEWLAFFDEIANHGNEATLEELREGWLAGMSSVYFPGDGPTQERLLKGMLNGEVGSLQEGPSVNEPAPDFTLKTHDGNQTIRLADRMGRRPVVLMFGNFTCGPFRSMCPGVEEVYRRFGRDAEFLGIYVREAHPTDGWKMFSNTRVGVEVAQPTNNDQRRAAAAQCHQLLKPSFPLLVDEIDDPVGNAYSGMPTRLYVIDSAGRVAYKGGRGPFGFSVGEMEQALVMTLLAEYV